MIPQKPPIHQFESFRMAALARRGRESPGLCWAWNALAPYWLVVRRLPKGGQRLVKWWTVPKIIEISHSFFSKSTPNSANYVIFLMVIWSIFPVKSNAAVWVPSFIPQPCGPAVGVVYLALQDCKTARYSEVIWIDDVKFVAPWTWKVVPRFSRLGGLAIIPNLSTAIFTPKN